MHILKTLSLGAPSGASLYYKNTFLGDPLEGHPCIVRTLSLGAPSGASLFFANTVFGGLFGGSPLRLRGVPVAGHT